MPQSPSPEYQPQKARICPQVFFSSLALIVLLVVVGALWPEAAQQWFSSVQHWIELKAGWLYVLGVAIFLLFIVFVMVSRFGDIKLGPDHSSPDYSYKSWIAMLFSAGMGIGLMFFGVAEPVMHFIAPPDAAPETVEAARQAMKITFFHWGIHAWAIYAVVALSLAYFSFRHKLPLLPRSALYPLIGSRIYGPVGHAVDTFAVLGTMFGVATSLGFGVLQLNAGLNFLFGDAMPIDTALQVGLIAVITLIATASVFSGLDKGVKRLSELNLLLATTLMIVVALVGPTVALLQAFVQNTGAYFAEMVGKTFNLYAYQQKNDWLGGWTLLYWGWWISWSPFVGTFIARVSRGRTIREFLVGVLFVPSGFTFLWMTVFGNSALDQILRQGHNVLSEAVSSDVAVALFVFFQQLPLTSLLSAVALGLVVTFFVTSSDSGSLVIDNLTSGGSLDSPVWQRIFWALMQGVVASVLLMAGGLKALQTAAIASAMPFLLVMLLICLGLYRALRDDWLKLSSVQTHHTSVQYAKAHVHWHERLQVLLATPGESEARAFIKGPAKAALMGVAQAFESYGVKASVVETDGRVRLVIASDNHPDFIYGLRLRQYSKAPVLVEDDSDADAPMQRVEVFLEHGGQHYDVLGYTVEQLQADAVTQYERYLHYLHLSVSEASGPDT